MFNSRLLSNRATRTRQRGMATTLLMMLTGVALTATTMGMMHSIRSAQDQQMASHASVSAESKAWEAVELVRTYLDAAQKANLSSLTRGQTLTTSVSGLTVKVSVPYDSTTGYIGFTLTGVVNANTPAASSSTVEAIYTVGSSGSATNTLLSTISLAKTLDLTGSIKFTGLENTIIAVDGDASIGATGGGSITGLTNLQATGDISIGSGNQVNTVFANGKLTLLGSASVTKGSAIKEIKNSSGGTQGALKTNATVTVDNGTTNEINAIGNVIVNSWPTTKIVNSGATVTCPSQYWMQYTSINAKATSGCPTANISNQVPASTLTALTPITVNRIKIDATDYKSSANYIFEYVSNKIRVTVSGINGITDGVYYLGKYGYQNDRGYNDFLCTATDASGNCTTPASPTGVRTLCEGQSTSNGCVTYSTGTWTVSGKSLAPGVLWFNGNLTMSNGRYYNTVVATGNITTSGDHKLWALNYAGYSIICDNEYPSGYKTTDFSGMYPIAFCDKSGTKLKSNALGNISYLSGLYTGSTFSGGIIKLGASSEVSGTIMAGDTFLTEGSSTVHGYITAAGQGSSVINTWGGSTTIDLTGAPKTYDPGTVPSTGGGPSTSTAVKWTRNL
ncbi:hypothetical protein PS3A_40410 [Pseudomonas sp. 3A(2025)]